MKYHLRIIVFLFIFFILIFVACSDSEKDSSCVKEYLGLFYCWDTDLGDNCVNQGGAFVYQSCESQDFTKYCGATDVSIYPWTTCP
jgi:hypothetical protein